MGIINALFGSKDSAGDHQNNNATWTPLTNFEQLDEIVALSRDRPQFIFKHSTSCGVSGMVLRMFKGQYKLDAAAADLYYLDLHSYRDLSDEIATRFGVYHQSPQLLVIKNGLVTEHKSHGAIAEMSPENYL